MAGFGALLLGFGGLGAVILFISALISAYLGSGNFNKYIKRGTICIIIAFVGVYITYKDLRGDIVENSGKKEQPTIIISAPALYRAYQANEAAADHEYKDKNLLITGSVAGITKNITGKIMVSLVAPASFFDIQAYLSSSSKEAAIQLKKGQKITMLCKGGGMMMTIVVLNDCVIK